MTTISNHTARQFLLLKHGLLGPHKFTGKQGTLDFVRQVGCIQFDPVDVCGKNAELTLQSRVKGFTKTMLAELLYGDRLLIDYPDKNLSIMPVEDLPYFTRYREAAREQAKKYPEMTAAIDRVRDFIRENGPVCSADLKLTGDFYWHSAIHWSSGTNLSRSVLEQMYTSGDLIIHHKKGSRKYYDLAEKYLPAAILHAPEPLPADFAHLKWRVSRRINAVGLLANRPSDAWLNIWGLTGEKRNEIFAQLVAEGEITEITVEGMKEVLYCRQTDRALIEAISQGQKYPQRCELLAPLDPFLWDRRLIKALFHFEYRWEIYTPVEKRKYGVYVLPLLWGERLIGRVEAVCERKTKTLFLKNIWYEEGVKPTGKLATAVTRCLKRFAGFNGCEHLRP